MLRGKTVLAIVPARAGSKGLVDKNIRPLAGVPLIGHTGRCLAALDWIDARVLSTDSEHYAELGCQYGLEVPALRPAHLAGDSANAVDVAEDAILRFEATRGAPVDVVLYVEPTSPLRRAADVQAACEMLIDTGADSVVTVSPLDAHHHPDKALALDAAGRLMHHTARGAGIIARQQMSKLLTRNGFCYAATRRAILEKRKFITDNTQPLIIDRPFANIDHALDFEWAEFLMARADAQGKAG